MSFSADLKIEITQQQLKNACCRKSFTDGVLISKARCEGENIFLNVETDAIAAFIGKYISEFYGRVPTTFIPKTGGRCRTVTFNSRAAAKMLLLAEDESAPLFKARCAQCEAAFFRGVFFASGNVSDPSKQYLLELSPVGRSGRLLLALSEVGVELRETCRKGKTVLYTKRSGAIEDFFAFIGANNAAFAFMNAKIKAELRNNANRISNCEMNNIDKAVSASHRQISVIEALEKANLLSSLPEELERTARLRLERRDLSLAQLAAVSVPSISKSGLSHRLNKIMDIAGQLMPEVKK